MSQSTTIKNIVVFVKLSDGTVREVVLNDEMKKEVFKVINKYQITVGEDVSNFLNLKQ